MLPVSLGKLVAKFATGVVDTGGAPLLEYLREFSKKFEMVLMVYSRAGGELILEKTRRKKSRDTVPLININKIEQHRANCLIFHF